MRKYLIITLALFVIVGCSQDRDPVAPVADASGPAIGSGEKAGGGGAPVAPECGYLLSPEGRQAFIDLAKAACNPQNSNVVGSCQHGPIPGYGITYDDSYSMRWQHVEGDLLKTYLFTDWCLWGEPHGHYNLGPVPEVTPEVVQFNADMVSVAMLPQNRATMIVDATGQPGGGIYCESWINGSYHVYFYYIGKAGATRAFSMRLIVSDNVIPTDPPSDPR